ncbi:plasmid mobilization relaxosome protein MobC, partial [Escherichia coli]|nr:plasmid mobilization relaxosome protein MobC [Escherichia coli]
MLTIRVTDDEHARLLERCEGKQLAVWMRRGCPGGPGARFREVAALAPPVRRQPGALGENPDQAAREGKSGQGVFGERGRGGGALMGIWGEVRRAGWGVRGKGGRGGSVS